MGYIYTWFDRINTAKLERITPLSPRLSVRRKSATMPDYITYTQATAPVLLDTTKIPTAPVAANSSLNDGDSEY